MVPDHLAHLKFREARNSDRQRIEQLIFTVLLEHGLEPEPETTDADLKDIEANYLRRGGVFDVVENAGALVGTVGLYPLDSATCELRKMYLSPAERGQGLGKYILHRVVARARELGFQKIVLETSSKLPIAIELYTKFGFTEIELHHASPRADQAYSLNL